MRFLKICLLILCMAFLAVAARQVAGSLPMPPAGLAGQKYAGFSGVLQIWYPENLPENLGSAAAWVSGVASIFEKNNAGVYVRLTAVPPERLADAAGAAQPPDMILFCPGEADAAGLLPLEADYALLPAFRRAGDWDGEGGSARVASGEIISGEVDSGGVGSGGLISVGAVSGGVGSGKVISAVAASGGVGSGEVISAGAVSGGVGSGEVISAGAVSGGVGSCKVISAGAGSGGIASGATGSSGDGGSPAVYRNGAGGGRYAVPVAAGGYVLAAVGELPEDLTALPEGTVGLPEGSETALAALCERYSVSGAGERTIAAPDIGLIAAATPEPTPQPVAGTGLRAGSLRAGTGAELYTALLNGEIRALALNERQVARVRAGQADGRYGDIRFLNAAGYTDRLLLAAIVDTRREDLDERAALCEQFIALLLSDEAQARLAGRGLFPTAMTDALYAGVSGLGQMEEALRRSDCVVRGAFDPPVAVDFASLLSGTRSARELMRELRNGR